MGLKIIRSTDVIQVKNVKVLIYGEPGVGKTSLGFTMGGVLCLDFDKGSHRSHRVGDVLEINSYGDVLELTHSEEGRGILSNFSCIMIDTAGTLLNYITQYIQEHECSIFGASRPGLYYDRRRSALTLQGYGVLKQAFKGFVDSFSLLKKDLLFISHESTERNGEELKRVPAVFGGSYDILMQQMDFIGHMGMYGNDRILDFSPSESHFGKDSGGLGRLVVPEIPPHIDFLGRCISRAKLNMGKVSKEVMELASLLDEYRVEIEGCEDVSGLNLALKRVREERIDSLQGVLKGLLAKRAQLLGCKFDKNLDSFVMCMDGQKV